MSADLIAFQVESRALRDGLNYDLQQAESGNDKPVVSALKLLADACAKYAKAQNGRQVSVEIVKDLIRQNKDTCWELAREHRKLGDEDLFRLWSSAARYLTSWIHPVERKPTDRLVLMHRARLLASADSTQEFRTEVVGRPPDEQTSKPGRCRFCGKRAMEHSDVCYEHNSD
jgi:hypothetical protein